MLAPEEVAREADPSKVTVLPGRAGLGLAVRLADGFAEHTAEETSAPQLLSSPLWPALLAVIFNCHRPCSGLPTKPLRSPEGLNVPV